MSEKPTKTTKATAAPSKASATARKHVKSTKPAPTGKTVIVTLDSWLPASGMKALRDELKAATGREPIILPPGATWGTVGAKASDGQTADA